MLVAASTSSHAPTTASSSVSWLRRVASPSDLPPLHATCLLSDLKYLLMWKLEEPCATNVLARHEKSFYQFVQCQLCRSYMDVAVSCELCKVHCIYGFTVPGSKGSTLVYKASDPELNSQVGAHESVNSF